MLKTPTLARTPSLSIAALLKPIAQTLSAPAIAPEQRPSKQAVRTSLKASTLDGIFASIFSCVTAEVLLSSFLLDLGATRAEIGMLAAIPMLANFVQPVGAYLADRAPSRRNFIISLFLPSRLLWLTLVAGSIFANWGAIANHQLVYWTLLITFTTHILGALGCASWASWMVFIVPQRLRGRYFGFRNSLASLTNLLCIPLLGFLVSHWSGGTIQGYSFILLLAIFAGLLSLACQVFKVDVNPLLSEDTTITAPILAQPTPSFPVRCLKDTNFLRFLLYYGPLMFSFNISAPFFNIYLLQDIGLDIGCVTLYTSLTAGANLVMLLRWGKLADRIGNRPILFGAGLAIALTPLFWLATGDNPFSIWVGFPLLYALLGATWSGMDLCNTNLQMAIASSTQPSSYFAIAAAIGGLGSALGMTAGGFLAQCDVWGGFPGLFALSAVLRLLALLPLAFVRER
ncbi:MAG: MFS transporter [Cyanobacteriota bacterium]|nr:MFS transporter [Cyanobacteriota bacterium]